MRGRGCRRLGAGVHAALSRGAGARPIGFRGEIHVAGLLRGRAAARLCPGEPRDVVFVGLFQLYDFRSCPAPYFLWGRLAARHVFCGGISTLRFSFVARDLFFVGETQNRKVELLVFLKKEDLFLVFL